MSISSPTRLKKRPRGQRRGAGARPLFEAAAAIVGVGAGVTFANPVLAAADGVWSDFVMPAYQTMIENGLLAWCM